MLTNAIEKMWFANDQLNIQRAQHVRNIEGLK